MLFAFLEFGVKRLIKVLKSPNRSVVLIWIVKELDGNGIMDWRFSAFKEIKNANR